MAYGDKNTTPVEYNPYSPEGRPKPTRITPEGSAMLDAIQNGPKLSDEEAREARRRYLEQTGADIADMKKSQVPSNIPGAGNPDGLTPSSSTDEFAEEGFQVVQPVSERPKKEEPILENDDADPFAYPKDPNAEPENPDWASTTDNWVSTNLNTEQKLQKEDLENPAIKQDESSTGETYRILNGIIYWIVTIGLGCRKMIDRTRKTCMVRKHQLFLTFSTNKLKRRSCLWSMAQFPRKKMVIPTKLS